MNQVNPANSTGIIADRMNYLGARGIPFLFIVDFGMKKYHIQPLRGLDRDILFKIGETKNYPAVPIREDINTGIQLSSPADLLRYERAFRFVIEEIRRGNTYILNLTFPSGITLESRLLDMFHTGESLFKLYYKNQFVSFSPERFVKIDGNIITTFPMKGTIDAAEPNALETILHDKKEMAEHVMVVDLLRNDLSMVARHVRVDRFRYVDRIPAGNSDLLQVSSQISGRLDPDWRARIGSIITTMLPAGSVTGAPKKKTVEIIGEVEGYERGFYTGIFGVFDGDGLDSAVLIRFIERERDGLFLFKSGGGITIDSSMESEYAEMIRKIYVPAGEGTVLRQEVATQ